MLNEYEIITTMEGDFWKIIIYKTCVSSIFYFYETK